VYKEPERRDDDERGGERERTRERERDYDERGGEERGREIIQRK